MEHLRAPAQGLAERRRSERHDHELLQVDVVVRVLAAVEHVHHRHRQRPRALAAQVAVEREAERVGAGPRRRERDAERGVGAEPALVGRAVQLDEQRVDAPLVAGVHALEARGDGLAHVAGRLELALAAVARGVAVAQLDRLVLAGGGAGRDGRPPEGAALEAAIHLECRIAA